MISKSEAMPRTTSSGQPAVILQCCLSRAWGGLEMVAYETAERLEKNGLNIRTAVLPESPLQKKLQQNGLKTLIVSPSHKYVSPTTILKLRHELKTAKTTTVLVQQLRDLWYLVPALIGHKKIKLVGIAHMFIDVDKRGPIHRWFYGRINHLIALTGVHKRNLLKHLPLADEQFSILPNTVDTQRFRPGLRDQKIRHELLIGNSNDALLIGIVTRIDPQKGLQDVVQAAALLKGKRSNWRIVIVGRETLGEENFKTELEHEIQRLDLTSFIHLVGHRSDIEAVMASLDVLLMPSPQETFGRVLIEAMASGVPVIASSGGGVADVVENQNTGYLIPPHDPQAMATALEFFMEHPEARQRFASRAQEVVKVKYNPETVDRLFYQLLL